jgi:chondroitin AC lyase
MKIIILTILTVFTLQINARDFSFDRIRNNIITYYLLNDSIYSDLRNKITDLNSELSSPDQVMIELYQKQKLNYKLTTSYLETLQKDSSWPDINYSDTGRSGWDPKKHAERILFLTKVYLDPTSPFYKKQSLSDVIHRTINFWFENRFVCRNWWYNEIGIPKTFGPVFIMLEDELSVNEIQQATRLMEQSKFGMTGQNKVWLAGNVFYKAVLRKDYALAEAARDTIVSEIRISEGEGIQPDYSFHQHGPQQQFGNYGLAFITTQTYWARIFNGTSMEIDENHITILHNLLINGYDWIVWNSWFDINGLGRQLFKDAQQTKGLAVAGSMLDMVAIDPENQEKYLAYFSRNYLNDINASLIGNKHFWRSDLTIHRSLDWYASIKMSSERVIGIEAGNGDNLKGYYLADGATYILVRGDEYKDIFPIWNWKKIPGITAYQNDEPLKVLGWDGYRNGSDFTGGVSSGKLGISATHIERDSLSAKKAWFFYDDMMICLGTNIHSNKNSAVSTILNQCHLNGPVVYFDGQLRTAEKETSISSEEIKWVYHDSVNYYFLNPARVKLSTKTQEGDWHEVASLYEPEIVSGGVFSIEFDHGKSPVNESYAYAIVPSRSPEKMRELKFNFTIVRNDSCCQAICSADTAIIMVIIHQPSSINFPGFAMLELQNAGLYIFEKSGDRWKISVSDPTQKLKSLAFRINTSDYNLSMKNGINTGQQQTLYSH